MSLFKKSPSLLDRIAAGRTDLVFEHMLQGGRADAHDSTGVSLLSLCSRYGDVSAVRYLMQHGERLESVDANLGLEFAAFAGHWRLCEFLVEQGADVNAANAETGETPLHAALCKPNRPTYDLVLRVLLAAGADPKRTTRANVETGGFMRDCRTKGETPLHRAAAFGSESMIDQLLDAGAVKDARDSAGDTPLSWASWHTRPDAILRKLCYGDHFVRKDRGSTFDHGAGWGFFELDLLGKPQEKA